MSDKSDSFLSIIPPYVRPKVGMQIAGVCHDEFNKRLASGRYKSFRDGAMRFVSTQSIIDDQKRLAEANIPDTPTGKGSGRRGRPRKASTVVSPSENPST